MVFLFVGYGRDACQEYGDSPATTFGCMNCEIQEVFRFLLVILLLSTDW